MLGLCVVYKFIGTTAKILPRDTASTEKRCAAIMMESEHNAFSGGNPTETAACQISLRFLWIEVP
jgi:hypothetical protein